MSALLWAAAIAATVWIVVPAIAFAFGRGSLRTEVLPDAGPPATHGDDSPFGPLLGELAALGFRAVGRTREIGRFISPMHWRWESYQHTQWLIGPDGRTYATMYRLVPGEPARISAVTMLDDGGMVRTSCPGPLPTESLPADYLAMAVRGVDAARLLAKHDERVETLARERGARTRAATMAEITATDDTLSWAYVRKSGASSYFLTLMFVPALLLPLALMRGRTPSAMAALGICVMAGAYALMRWALLGPILRYNARRAHTEDITGKPDDVAENGTILATGENERRLRILAAVAAVLASAWPIALARKLPAMLSQGGGGLIMRLVFIAISVMVTVQLAGRARGRMVWSRRNQRDPVSVWTSLVLLNVVYTSWLDWSEGPFHRLLYVVGGLSILLGIVAWRLEKKRGK